MSGALWSSTPASGSPVCEDHNRDSCDNAAEWKVRASTPSTPSDSSRRLSSPAALSVNVTARICDASNAPLRTWHAMRWVIVVVFPVPAPARIATGPRSARAASRWGSFSPARTLSRLRTSPTLTPVVRWPAGCSDSAGTGSPGRFGVSTFGAVRTSRRRTQHGCARRLRSRGS